MLDYRENYESLIELKVSEISSNVWESMPESETGKDLWEAWAIENESGPNEKF